MKQCWKCKELGLGPKAQSEFNKDAGGTLGLQGLCREHQRAKYQVWLALNGEKNRTRNAEWYAAHPEKVEDNKVRWAAHGQRRDETQPQLRAAREAKRRAMKLQRTPKWADFEKIEDVFAQAQAAREFFPEVEWNVDHVYPLQGNWVSGLHVHENLQVLPGVENSRKGARRVQVEFQKDMRDLVRAAQSLKATKVGSEPTTSRDLTLTVDRGSR